MISKLRKEKNLTQAELAKLSGIRLRTIQAYESGTRDINKASGETLYCLAKALNTTIEKLINIERIEKKCFY